jgi:hypothetical protein
LFVCLGAETLLACDEGLRKINSFTKTLNFPYRAMPGYKIIKKAPG